MKILSLDIPEKFTSALGLKPVVMPRLGKMVLLAGKNGGGKTRLLKLLTQQLKEVPTIDRIQELEKQIGEANSIRIPELERNIKNYRKKLAEPHLSQSNRDSLKSSIASWKEQIISLKKAENILEQYLSWSIVKLDMFLEKYEPVDFVPKSLSLSDNRQMTKDSLRSYSKNIDKVGLDQISQGCLARIAVIQEQYFSATHPESRVDSDNKDLAIRNYLRLKDIIKVFLNSELDIDKDGDPTIFGFPIGKAPLSDGQKILLQFCMGIYAQGDKLSELLIFMDEPENHLHPAALIETVDRIVKAVPNGQVWISTHSIPLLAHFNPNDIWFVEDGAVRHAGKIPERVLESLLGDENEIQRLRDFISLPAELATNRYAFESLLEPLVLDTPATDPQTRQIRNSLFGLAKDGILKILDFGAGKGRLISNIVEQDQFQEEKLLSKIEYVAFDEYPYDMDFCKSAIETAYQISENRYFNTIDQLLARHDKGSFQVVVMCNVLHEIPSSKWLELFGPNGCISTLLSENGILLLVEDQFLPTGEKAYQQGFLVLDTPHLKDLFHINSEKDKAFSFDDSRGDGRLKAHQIPKDCLVRMTNESRITALEELKKTAQRQIINLREGEKNYRNGNLHGFWTQQLANAELNLLLFKS